MGRTTRSFVIWTTIFSLSRPLDEPAFAWRHPVPRWDAFLIAAAEV